MKTKSTTKLAFVYSLLNFTCCGGGRLAYKHIDWSSQKEQLLSSLFTQQSIEQIKTLIGVFNKLIDEYMYIDSIKKKESYNKI